MIRKFNFEADVYNSLNCLPMAARGNLDMLASRSTLHNGSNSGEEKG